MNTFLVTGAFGLAGRATVEELMKRGERIVAFDIAPKPNILPDNDRVVTVKGDVSEIVDVIRSIKQENVDHIIHLAIIHLERVCHENPLLAFRVNVKGTMNILEAARLMDVKKTVLASTGSVYQQGAKHPITEDHPKKPETLYAATKLAAEQLGINYHNEYGLDIIALRFGGLYGMGSISVRGPMRSILHKCLQGETAIVRGPSSTSNPFNLLYSKDAAKSAYLASYASRLEHRIFNIDSGETATLDDIIQVAKMLIPDAKIKKEYYVGRASAFNISRARTELNYHPEYNLKKGFTDYFYEFQQYQARVNNVDLR
jgi:UDP-glucose 4-epimerase